MPGAISRCEEIATVRLPAFGHLMRQGDPHVLAVVCPVKESGDIRSLFGKFAELPTRRGPGETSRCLSRHGSPVSVDQSIYVIAAGNVATRLSN
jgi:hypothetical protein